MPVIMSRSCIQSILETTRLELSELRAGCKRTRDVSAVQSSVNSDNGPPESAAEASSVAVASSSSSSQSPHESPPRGSNSPRSEPTSPTSELASALATVVGGVSPRSLVRLLAQAHARK